MSRYKVYIGLYEDNPDTGAIAIEPPLESGDFLDELVKLQRIKSKVEADEYTELHVEKRALNHRMISAEDQLLKVQSLIVSHLANTGHEVDSSTERVVLRGNGRSLVPVMEECERYFDYMYGPATSQPTDTMAY